jgi:septal ring factor EnvC (AmiA/AmiB activator)
MSARPSLKSFAVAAAAGMFLFAGTVPAIAIGEDDGYPSWAEVEAARASTAATEAEYTRLETALTRARTEAEAVAAKAAAAVVEAERAEKELRAAVERESQLQARAEQAQVDLTENSDALARMISWMYVNGTGLSSASELMISGNPEEFMANLSTATQVSSSWAALAERAEVELNNAASLEEQADAARQERERLADAAEQAAAEAAAAQEEADAAVAVALDRADTMYEQLASLRGTTAEAERQYQLGLQVAADQAAQTRQREEAAQNSGTGGSSSGSGSVIVDPAGAQAYARARLGAYGWSDSQFSCLVSLWNGESNWRADALNPYSGAYGIPQSLPAEKMATAGADWRTNGNTQVEWGLAYISAAYGSPCAAWNRWQSRSPHWY